MGGALDAQHLRLPRRKRLRARLAAPVIGPRYRTFIAERMS
jgi:hypothetical protein